MGTFRFDSHIGTILHDNFEPLEVPAGDSLISRNPGSSWSKDSYILKACLCILMNIKILVEIPRRLDKK